MDIAESDFTFQVISSELSIEENTLIHTQSDFLDAFLATVTIKDSIINDWVLDGVMFQITASNINMMNLNISDISTAIPTEPMIRASLDSHLYMNNTSYSDSQTPFLNVLASSSEINYLTALDFSGVNYFIRFEQTTNATLEDWNIKNLSVSFLIPMLISDSYIHSMKRMQFDTAYAIFFQISKSTVNLMQDSVIKNSVAGPFYIFDSNINMVDNCTFQANGLTLPLIAAVTLTNCTYLT